MAGKIVIDIEQCKGCDLCVTVCPKSCIVISRLSNKRGYFPAEATNAGCTGCCLCAIICPDVVIKVFRDEGVVSVQPSKKSKPGLIKEKA